MIPETEKEIAVRNHRMFARVSCRVLPGRVKSSIRASNDADTTRWRVRKKTRKVFRKQVKRGARYC